MSKSPRTYRSRNQHKPAREEREKKREQREREKELESLKRKVSRLEKRLAQATFTEVVADTEDGTVLENTKVKDSPGKCPNCSAYNIKILVAPTGTLYFCDSCGGKGKLNG